MSLLDAFAIVFDTKGADKAQNDIKNVTRTVASTVASFVGFKKLMSTVFSQAGEARELGQMAFMANTSTDAIQGLGHALKRFGGDNKTAFQDMSNMTKQLTDAYYGQQGPLFEAMKKHGILDIFDDSGEIKEPLEVLERISELMGKMKQTDALHFGKLAGLSHPMIMLLSRGLKEFNEELERSKKYAVFTQEDVKASTDLLSAWDDLMATIEQTYNVSLRPFRDDMVLLFKYLEDGLKTLQEYPLVLSTIASIGAIIFGGGMVINIGKVLNYLLGIGPALKVISSLGGVAFTALGAALSGTALTIGGIVAGLGLIAVSIHDIWAVCNNKPAWIDEYLGNKSVLGSNGPIANFAGSVMDMINPTSKRISFENEMAQLDAERIYDEKQAYKANTILQQTNSPFIKSLFTPNVYKNDNFEKSRNDATGTINNINIQTIEIKTNATDAKKISEEIEVTLREAFGTTVRQFAGSRVV